MTFRNSILAGLTLIRQAIQSQNYLPGISGWKIAADGKAEFSDLTIRSSDGTGAVVEIENGKVICIAPSGWKIIIDPAQTFPAVFFLDGDGDEAGAINATGDNTRAGLVTSSGPFADGPILDWRWIQHLGQTTLQDQALITRARDSDSNHVKGGFFLLDSDTAQLAIVDTADPTVQTLLQITNGVTLLDRSRLYVSARPSAQPAFRVDVNAAGHTGFMLHLQREGAAKFTVDKDGNTETAGNFHAFGGITADQTVFTSYTPVVVNGGTATFTNSGYYYRLGDLVYVNIDVTVVAAGSGAVIVTVSLPVAPDRTDRQVLACHGRSVWSGGMASDGVALIMDSGSGAQIDQLSTSNDNANNRDGIVTGVELRAGSRITISGWYRAL